jgi:nucleobase:cation symporter-1, NCS1 family
MSIANPRLRRTQKLSRGLFERGTIGSVPDSERHGGARDLFTLWAACNQQILTIITGVIGTAVFGLPFIWSVFAIVVGTLAGAVFMALHAVQGARLGVPQMLQTRGQFGSWGALPIVVVVIVMYVGFSASSLVVAGPAVHALIPALSPDVGIALAGIVAMAIALYGYDVIHGIQRVCTPIFAAALILLAVWVIFVHGLPAGFLSKGKLAFGPLLGMVSIAAIFQISYAPYVSDYSRYLPRAESSRPVFWATYLGTSIGTIFPMAIGAILGIIITGDTVLGIDAITGPVGWLMMIIVFIGTANATAYNLYGFSLCSITAAETFKTGWIPRGWVRVLLVTAITLGSLLIAIAAASAFLVNFTNLLTILFYLLIPWTTVNLLDYYVVKKGSYDVPEFFKPNGGIYGRVQWPALVAYILGIAVQVPFMDTTWYEGTVAKAINGDISWIVGLAASALLYLGLSKRTTARRTRSELRSV